MGEALWALFTVAAAAGQTARNALQAGLTAQLGTAGATTVRFVYGAPFALVFLGLGIAALGAPPAPSAAALGFIAAGAFAQVVATGLLLAALRERAFVVVVAYSKTEPLQAALVAALVLGEVPTPMMALALLLGTAGVVVMAWPRAGAPDAGRLRAAVLGIAAGGLFALSAVGFRGGILALGHPSFVLAATTALVLALTLQAALLALLLALLRPALLADVAAAWRASLLAGFAGAAASQLWFLAFALETVARVRTLGLIEVVFAWAVSQRMSGRATSVREGAGILLVLVGVALMLNAG